MFPKTEEMMSEAKVFRGSCHCGAVSYEVRTALDQMMDCNCSRCKRLGSVLQPAAAADFTLLSGTERLKPYRFHTRAIEHLFCSECGIQSFARGTDAEGRDMVMINVNCLEHGPDVDRSAIYHWDGRSA